MPNIKVFRFFSNSVEYYFPYTEQGYHEMCYYIYTRNLHLDKFIDVVEVSSDTCIVVLSNVEKNIIKKKWKFYSELFA